MGTPTHYVVEWQTTETIEHYAVVDAATMAGMLGVTVDQLPDDVTAVQDTGDRGLEDGLADVEDSDTEVSYDGPYRDEITVRTATPEEIATAGQ